MVAHSKENAALESAAMSSYSIDDEIDSVCEKFADRWSENGAPAIEHLLDAVAAEHRGRLLIELIRTDMDRRSRQGEQPSEDDYLDRFPEYREQIEQLKHAASRTRTVQLDSSVNMASHGHVAGHRLGHYVLIKKVGSGTFGEVWKARDTQLNRVVALKVPRPAYVRQVGIGSTLREGRAAAKLRHPHIVAIHAIEESGEVPLIVSDYVEGESLKAWLKSHKPSFEEIALLCAKLADALQHAHDAGVIHRDLKPSNVLMDAAGEPYIADFGLAKNLTSQESITVDGQIMGTPAYMSPEQARGDSAHVDGRADVFALGVMLYEMLSGEQPFQGDQSTVMLAILHREPRGPRHLRREIPRDLETICLKALSKEPARRYASAQEMSVDLRRYLRGDAILARRPGMAERTWRWTRKHPGWASAVGLATVALVAVGIIFYLMHALDDAIGYRTVQITTEPPGARLAFAPLNPATGKPIDEQVIYAQGVTPLQIRLPPDDYFVVAVLGEIDSPEMRFHEVYRHVPKNIEIKNDGELPHQKWKLLDDGDVYLPIIYLPNSSINREMARFCSKDGVTRDFLLDPCEYTIGQYRTVRGRGPSFYDGKIPPDSYALTANYHIAVAVAEDSGKRLPFDEEFACAANLSTLLESEIPSDHDVRSFGPIVPINRGFDRTDGQQGSVWGLHSNVAEWTASRIRIGRSDFQIVRGGDGHVADGHNHLPREAGAMAPVSGFERRPGLGLRLARSDKPRYFEP